MKKIKPSTVEQSIGLTTFYTNHPGIGGILRFQPEDFVVIEQSQRFPVDSKGRNLLVQVTAKNWETNDLIREFGNHLHISKKRISFAGTKDKRAVSTQVFNFYNINEESINALSIPDVECMILHRTGKRLSIGDLIGNTFHIVIRKIPSTIKKENIDRILDPLIEIQGFPNFFGVQRFGGIRPLTHKVGRAMVDADFKKAVMIYLTETSKFETEDATNARKKIKETEDFKAGFHLFPKRLRFEKIMMQYLTKHPKDYAGALQRLPQNLQTMCIYAFQSYLFNRMISERIKHHIPLHKAIIGDIILPITHDGVSIDPIIVEKYNITKINQQIKKGKAVVSCILPGSETLYANGEMGSIQQEIINKEKVDIRDFVIPEVPAASSYGLHRPILASFHDLSASLDDDEKHRNYQKLTLSFSLKKGSYATSLLREIMKLKDISFY